MQLTQRKESAPYHAALYLRLSKDDADIDGRAKTESNSIASQRELLQSFVSSQPDIRVFDVYVDDGYSGSNFDRPEFKRMTSDIEEGRVNCVIVKDLSRFGREYIEAGRLIQKIYPAFQVRFIAVTDHFDSKTADVSEKFLVVPIKNFINDSYCRDISVKVRSHQQMKREKGEFMGAFAPYGYQKEERNRHCLVVDPYASEVVRKIYAWKIAGLSLGAIAGKLNARHVLSPKAYRKQLDKNCHWEVCSTESSQWSAVQIKRILTNEVYLGNMVQGKQERISYKVKKRRDKPVQEWVRVEHTHPAVISRSDYEIVQKLLQYDGRASKTSEGASLFSGFLFCGDCNTPMIRRVNQYKGKEKVFYICRTKNKGGNCTRHSISEEILQRIVLKEIQIYFSLFADCRVLEEVKGIKTGHFRMDGGRQIRSLKEEYHKYCSLKISLYDDWKDGVINQEEFQEFSNIYEKKCGELERKIREEKRVAEEVSAERLSAAAWLEEWKTSFKPQALDRTLLALTVNRIYIFENKQIEVILRCKDEMENKEMERHLFCAKQGC